MMAARRGAGASALSGRRGSTLGLQRQHSICILELMLMLSISARERWRLKIHVDGMSEMREGDDGHKKERQSCTSERATPRCSCRFNERSPVTHATLCERTSRA